MNFSWAALQKSIREFWVKLTRSQRIITVAAPLLVATALLALIVWAGRPQYVPLFSKIDMTSAAAVRSELVNLKIPYQLQDGGSTILVPQAQVADARLQLASAGVPQGSKFSFDYLNQMQLGETDADRQLRYELALQDELANTLKTLNGVQDATVHIVMPQPSLFSNNTQAATAAVTLKLAPGTKLSAEQIRGVANLLAASVEGLKPGNVTIVDTNGSVLSDVLNQGDIPGSLSGSQLQIQQAVENRIQQSVQSMLDQALGTGNTVVRVNASLNFDQVKVTSDTYSPGTIVSQQTTNENDKGSTVGATPGVNTNVPGYTATTGAGTTSTTSKSSNTSNYQPDKTQKVQTVSPGSVQRLSISVMADSNKVTPTQLASIKGLVTSASGLNPARGDQIQVSAIPFDTTALNQAQAAMAQAQKTRRILRYAELGAGVFMGLVFLLVLLRTRSKRKRVARELITGVEGPHGTASAQEILLAQQRAEEEAQAKLAQKKTRTVAEIERQKIRESVEQYTHNNADEAARLVKTWLSEEN